MTYKETFLRQKELREKLAAVTHADWFKQAMIYVRSELMSSKITTEELEGARKFEGLLMTIADFEVSEETAPKTGLHHDLDVAATRKPAEPKEK